MNERCRRDDPADRPVDFVLADDGSVVLVKVGKKVGAPKSRFDRIRGIMKTDMTTDEIMALMRGDPAEV